MEEALGFSMMATESPMKIPAVGLGNGKLEGFEMDMEVLLLQNQQQRRSRAAAALERERELNIFRSGSAPPTVEGARNAVGSIFGDPNFCDADLTGGFGPGGVLSEEELRLHPAYLSYYYSNENVNPRLPPPAISKEDWRVAQRFQASASTFGRIGDRRKNVGAGGADEGSSSSLYTRQHELPLRDVEEELADLRIGSLRNAPQKLSAEWGERGSDGLFGLPGIGLGARRKSFADVLQEELGNTLVSGHSLSRPASRNTFDSVMDPVGVSGSQLSQLQNGLETIDSLKSGTSSSNLVTAQNLGSSVVGSSLVRSVTPDPQFVRKSATPSLPAFGGRDKMPSNSASVHMTEHEDIQAALSGLTISRNKPKDKDNDVLRASHQEFVDKTDYPFNASNNHNTYLHQNMNNSQVDSLNISSVVGLSKKNGVAMSSLTKLASNGEISLPNNVKSAHAYPKVSTGQVILSGSCSPSQNTNVRNVDLAGSYASSLPMGQRLPSFVNSQLDAGGMEGQYITRNGSHTASGIQLPLNDPLFAHYQQLNDSAARLCDPSLGSHLIGSSQVDLSTYQKAYIQALLAQHKLQNGMSFLGKSGGSTYGYRGTPGFGFGMQYTPNPLSYSILSSLGSVSPPTDSDRSSRFPSMLRGSTGGSMGSWNAENSASMEGFASSLLEEFKSNKTRTFELSDIVDHVVEFRYSFWCSLFTFFFCYVNLMCLLIFASAFMLSADQHGSRFIQQKLETASVEEKNKIFPEVLPHARALMTDVFGNYVIQKFFEHGTESQRKQLAHQLTGHVLPLSLQMYGCRVIQKVCLLTPLHFVNSLLFQLFQAA
ncbi:hypothetical protein Taro_020278, partial [Colocasia esculenta]|nr:hypothetical protein [Colocasia esculenta]